MTAPQKADLRPAEDDERPYVVRWEIEVDAPDPRAAAAQAQEIQRDRDSVATVFTVRRIDERGRPTGPTATVDLGKVEP